MGENLEGANKLAGSPFVSAGVEQLTRTGVRRSLSGAPIGSEAKEPEKEAQDGRNLGRLCIRTCSGQTSPTRSSENRPSQAEEVGSFVRRG